MDKYDLIYEAVQEAYDNDEITLEEAEFLNDYAYDKYITEDGHSKKLKARHNNKKRNIEKRFYDNMNYKHDYTDENGNKHGTVSMNGSKETPISIYNKNIGRDNYDAHYSNKDGRIHIGKKRLKIKGSDLIGAHEYSHSLDDTKKDDSKKSSSSNALVKKIENKRELIEGQRHLDKLNKKDDFDRKLEKEKKILKDSKNRSLNFHDRDAHEIRADIYAIKSINKNHGPNIMRKSLNERGRRYIQSNRDKHSYHIDDPRITENENKKKILECEKKIKSDKVALSEVIDEIKKLNTKGESDKLDIYAKMKSDFEKSIKSNEEEKII